MKHVKNSILNINHITKIKVIGKRHICNANIVRKYYAADKEGIWPECSYIRYECGHDFKFNQ